MVQEIIIDDSQRRVIKTKLGDVTILVPVWEDYFDIFANVPEKFTKLPEKEAQKKMVKFMGRYVMENWIISPDVGDVMNDPKWAVTLLGISLELIEPLKELMILKKKPPKLSE